MRILVEALGISKYGGGRSATIPLFEALLPISTDNEFFFVLDAVEPTLKFENTRQIIVPIKNRFAARLWLQLNLSRLVKIHQIDLVHFAKNLTIMGIPVKTLVTLYDLTLLQYPDGFSKPDLWYWRYIQPHLLRKVTKIHAISHNTANDLTHFYQIPPNKIEVIYPPYRSLFKPQSATEISDIQQKYQFSGPTITHIGSFGPKKNLETLLHAFAEVAALTDLTLLLVGGPYRPGFDKPVRSLVAELGIESRVKFTGIVPLRELPQLIGASTMVVYPSLHEGFGIAAVEAMACGVPLIVAKGGALQETVANAAKILKNPLDYSELAQLILELYGSPELQQQLKNEGLQRSTIFSAENIARKMDKLYRTL